MSTPILVTGGTGTLGGRVVPLLREAGRAVRVLSRRPHESGAGPTRVVGDLLTGEGVDDAVAGVRTVVHLAGGANAKGDAQATRTLTAAAARAGVTHVVFVSVIGAGRVPLAYFRNKYEAEQVVADSGLGWTTIRVAQVHDLVLSAARAMAKLPVVPAPKDVRFQPVDPGEVAGRVAALAQGEPAGLVADLAGPRTYPMPELLRGYLRAAGRRRPLLPMPVPGKAGRAYRAGENLAGEGAELATRTWEDFLAARFAASRRADQAR